jgi:hypothetical protein
MAHFANESSEIMMRRTREGFMLHVLARCIMGTTLAVEQKIIDRARDSLIFTGDDIGLIHVEDPQNPPDEKEARRAATKRNLVWELLVAAIVGRYCKNVYFSPRNAPEPDVYATFWGHKWGLECKTFHVKTALTGQKEPNEPPLTAEEILAKQKRIQDKFKASVNYGAFQIERGRCERGLLMTNLIDCLDHTKYMDDTGDEQLKAWRWADEVWEAIESDLSPLRLLFDEDQEFVNSLTKSNRKPSRKIKGVMLFATTPALVRQLRPGIIYKYPTVHVPYFGGHCTSEFDEATQRLFEGFMNAFTEALGASIVPRTHPTIRYPWLRRLNWGLPVVGRRGS